MKEKIVVRKAVKPLMKARKKLKKKKPVFKRQEGFKHVKLEDSWRRPRGRHSKKRKMEKARGSHPSIGYSSPKAVRGLDRLGYREIHVSNPSEIERIDPREEVVIITGSVGRRKRTEIIRAAEERKIRIKNF